jgi:hypothetical protein
VTWAWSERVYYIHSTNNDAREKDNKIGNVCKMIYLRIVSVTTVALEKQ